jgi:hypothetical protein
VTWLDPFLAGKNAYTTTLGSFLQPALSANVNVPIVAGGGGWMVPGQPIFVGRGGGLYTFVGLKDPGTAILTNLGTELNASPGTTIAAGAGVSPGGGAGLSVVEKDPDQLVFTLGYQTSWFDPIPAGLVYLTETFGSTAPFTQYTENSLGAFTVASNQGQIVQSSGAARSNYLTDGADISVPQVMVMIDVVSRSGSAGNSYENVGVGIVKDDSNYCLAEYDNVGHTARFHMKIAGTANFYASVSQTLTAPYSLALSIVGVAATMWKIVSGTWTALTTVDLSSPGGSPTFNPKTASLTGWKAGFSLATPGTQSATWTFANLKAGRFGGVGIRDMNIVSNQDGTPIVTNGAVNFLATLPDPAGIASQGVMAFNLDTKALSQVGLIMISRDAAVQNDVAGQIVAVGDGTFHLTIATWGSPSGFGNVLKTNHKHETSLNLLSGVNVVGSMSQLNLTQAPAGGDVGSYDCVIVKNANDGFWYAAYAATPDTNFVGNPQYICLDRSPDLVTWTNIGADASNTGFEGTKILKTNSDYWVIGGGRTAGRLYDLTLTLVEPQMYMTTTGGTLTFPWPLIFPWKRSQYLLTFDDTKYGTASFTWGNLQLHLASRY